MSDRTCAADECDRPVYCRGYCTKHYQQLRKSGALPIVQPHREHRSRPPECVRDECSRPVQARELCSHHYAQATWKTPEVAAQRVSARRARKRAARVGDPAEFREYAAILRADPCSYCGAPGGQLDHIIPLASGGAESWDNLTSACATCNRRKHARSLLEFLMLG